MTPPQLILLLTTAAIISITVLTLVVGDRSSRTDPLALSSPSPAPLPNNGSTTVTPCQTSASGVYCSTSGTSITYSTTGTVAIGPNMTFSQPTQEELYSLSTLVPDEVIRSRAARDAFTEWVKQLPDDKVKYAYLWIIAQYNEAEQQQKSIKANEQKAREFASSAPRAVCTSISKDQYECKEKPHDLPSAR